MLIILMCGEFGLLEGKEVIILIMISMGKVEPEVDEVLWKIKANSILCS